MHFVKLPLFNAYGTVKKRRRNRRSRRKPPFLAEFVFLPLFAKLDHFQSSEIQKKIIQISLIFSHDTFKHVNIKINCKCQILRVKWKYMGNFYEKKSFSQMIENCEKRQKKIRREMATAMPNLWVVTFYLTDFLWLLVLVSKSVTSASPLTVKLPFKQFTQYITYAISRYF